MVWSFLSTTVQLPATQRKVEGEEREIQLVHVNEANEATACIASSRRESGAYQTPPPLLHPRNPIAEF